MATNGYEIVELAKLHNALLPISQLPDSLLADIFDHYRKSHSADELIILQITHVCHSWRVVASSYGRLWTDIYVVCPDQAQRWLARSARCRLEVKADIAENEWEYQNLRRSKSNALCFKLVLEELPRIRTLDLVTDVGFTKEQLSRSRWTHPPPSPSLQSLKITVKASSKGLDNFFSPAALVLSRDLPSLTNLSIINDIRFFPNNVRLPPSLKHLEICGMDPAADWDPNIASVMLAVLDALPSLEALQLAWINDVGFFGAVPAVERQVTLRHLRELNVVAFSPPHICTRLLNHLTFPSAAKIKLHAGHVDELQRKSFLESVALKLDGGSSDIRPLHSFCIGCKALATDHVDMDGWSAAHFPDSESFGHKESDIRIILYDTSSDYAFIDLAQSIHLMCTTLPLSKVEILTLHYVCLDVELWSLMMISQNMPALHTLHIRGWSYQLMWPHCQFHVAFRVINEVELFPNLKNVYLEDLFLRRLCESIEDERETVGFWEFLVQLLTSRKGRGASIEKLTVRACEGVDGDRRNLLQGLVDKFIWEPTARNPDL